ncbi:NUDIX hydrolase domain protein [Acididesulfobacillus acetoxydans]|uniref:Hydrolase, NUDIX n=1 Tax=Acididesulfobacillus acetoxydans TaxID=1561005 RepID=A0A8S0Y1W9_9FIRM|nr:NUDIX hydrolase [Acididesulfobacillus acetoxydans]CAA7600035.1 NUDIX hydrolase domain protein [Acididesulfobacillus acetoxydans]CEJ07810.1 Hydrolase, NUDIX [Acididesulfobacillus acetoxydans]
MHPVTYHFCPQCGRPLGNKEFGARTRSFCPDCSFVHWGDFTLGVGGILWHGGKALLVQRAHNPGRGIWTLPGGYVEAEENIENAVAREVREETGIETQASTLIAVRDRPGEEAPPQPHDLYLIFLLRYLSGSARGDEDEVRSLGFFTLEEARRLSIAPLTLHMLEATLPGLTGFERIEGVKMLGERPLLFRTATPRRE